MVDWSRDKKELTAMTAGASVFTAAGLITVPELAFSWGVGYFTGWFAVLSHFVVIRLIRDLDQQAFLLWFYLSVFVRFFLILTLFTTLLLSGNFEQISFTLSFIISYIFHSVIDVILINKTFASRHS
ncbi:MAG: hypothetical protein WD317_00665 [Balneolaceae bacterium]